MNISIANINQLEGIYKLTQACALDMISKGIYQWNESYPPKNKLKEDIQKGELYCIADKAEVIGIVVITEYEDKVYKDIKWLTEQGESVYIHRLAVHPDNQGKGYASELMDFAEGFSLSMGHKSIRLDTFSKNLKNNTFYKKRGYKQLGDIFLQEQSEHPFHCYELVL